MKNKLLLLSFALCGFLVFQSCSKSLSGSFTGKIRVSGYKVTNGQMHKINDESAILYFTPKRIKIKVESKEEGPAGILIRNDSSDIVIIAGSSKAMKITKSDINSLMSLAGGFMGLFNGMTSDSLITFKKTGNTKKIDGYKSRQFVFSVNMSNFGLQKSTHMNIWMTNALNINWGFLPDLLSQMKESANITRKGPADFVLKDGYFPVLVKQYIDSSLAKVVKVNITKTNSVESHVQLPPGMKVMGVKQYFENALRHLGQALDSLGQTMNNGMPNDSSSAIKT